MLEKNHPGFFYAKVLWFCLVSLIAIKSGKEILFGDRTKDALIKSVEDNWSLHQAYLKQDEDIRRKDQIIEHKDNVILQKDEDSRKKDKLIARVIENNPNFEPSAEEQKIIYQAQAQAQALST